MSDSKSAWVSAALGVIVIALAGATLWKVTRPDDRIGKRLAAIDAKIEAANAALAKTQTASTAVVTNDKLAQLDARITKINETLSELQQGTLLKSVGEKLDALNARIKNTDAALAAIQNATPSGVADKLQAINASLAELQHSLPTTGKLDELGASLKSADDKLAEIKQAIPSETLVDQFSAVASQMKSIKAVLADLQQATADGGPAVKAEALQATVRDLKKSAEEAAMLRAKLADQIGKLQDAVASAAKPNPSEVVVVYLDLPENAPMPRTVATVSPLRIQFNEIGSADDEGQAALIAAKLQEIVKNRKGCTISVAGYADTLGGDKTNLTLSKKRARVIAEKLKTAFAGKPVQINESAWGERRLASWTPDETAQEANRRVDVTVSCKE